MIKNFITVFKDLKYSLFATFVAWAVFSIMIWLPNHVLIMKIAANESFSLASKVSFLFSLYGALGVGFTLFSALYTVTIALLFGINVALFVYYIRKRQVKSIDKKKITITSVAGLVAGFFGVGCAACGSIIITSILSLFGAGALLTLLPFGGEEFGVLSVGLLLYSIYTLLKKMDTPLVCDIKI